MLKNLILVALRNFKKDKGYSLLNILGLTIGITFSLFLIFYIKDELSYDRYHEKGERIVRINSYIKEADKDTMKWANNQYPLGPTLKKDYPEVEEAVRFVPANKNMYRNGDTKIFQDKVFFTDSNVFRVFTYEFIEGNPRNALVEPNSMVLTESVAEKFFGSSRNIVGKSLQNDNGDVYKITAVLKDVPKHSHLIFNALISTTSLPKDFGNNWGSFFMYNYVLLRPNTNIALFEQKLRPMYKKYMAEIFDQFNVKIRYGVQPIRSIHLHSEMAGEPEELGSMSYIYIFSAVAFFMLLIACINYMNMATARSARRAKEIGIRKVTGSTRRQLVAQFLVESVLTAIIALLLSLILIAIFLPTFNTLAGKFIPFSILFEPGTFLIILGVVVFVGVVGGSYPAFYLSKFNPVSVLKGSLSKSSSNITLRRSLVVLQFTISMTMLICTWIVYAQLKYLRNVDLGFSKEQVLLINANSNKDVNSKILAFKNEMHNQPRVISVGSSQAAPGSDGVNFNLFSIETKSGYTDKGVDCYAADEGYLNTLGMKIIKGRGFTGISDTVGRIVVNESMVKAYGWDNPIGKHVKYPGDTSAFYLEVVGVVKDFNQKSLYNAITPLLIFYRPNNNKIEVKLQAKDIPATIASIEKTWKTIFPELPFQYTFLDQDFDSQYAADQKRGKIFTAFSILTIFITCLGLLGLIAFTTEQRQKEISLRKIMGAGLVQIIPLITRNFVFLVFLSCFIAFPVAYLFMNKWLQVFPYNTGIHLSPFIISAFIVLLITLLTVIFHTVKASVANPVKSLRSE